MTADGRPVLVVAGGGTGGHVLAGIAIADAWAAKHGTKPLFIGAVGGLETRLVPQAGYPLELLSLGSLKGVDWGRRIKTLVQLPIALTVSLLILMRERPAAVVGVGGYASGPVVLVARLFGWLWGVKTAILEQNAIPGFTNRILARLAHRIFTAFPGTLSRFPAGRVTVTGNPTRSSIQHSARPPGNTFTVFIFGGSQGAVGINTLMIDSLAHLAHLRDRIHFIHQTGEQDFDRVANAYAKAGFRAKIEQFIVDMQSAYSQSSLVVCRAGSSTISELAAAGRAAVFIPFPFASDNHQEANARILVDAGAALLLRQKETSGADIAGIIRTLVDNPGRIAALEAAISLFHRPLAASTVVDLLTGDR